VVNEQARQIARHWQREIEEQIRRAEAHDQAPKPWRTVSWLTLWLLWLVLLFAFIVLINPRG
jgi:hypothetical protein